MSDFSQNSTVRGFTRDICHTNGNCGNIGDGNWDVSTYFQKNHPLDTVPSGSSARRYSIYKWELDKNNISARLPTRLLNPNDDPGIKTKGSNKEYTYKNQCAYSQPVIGTAVAANGQQKDRRVLTIAGVDCAGMAGKDKINIKKWIDVFLVEPSSGSRTSPYSTGQEQIYVEIIGVATTPDGGEGFQQYGRNRPYLLK